MADDGDDEGGVAHLTASARGWHGVQLAVLGFIGLCGVLQGGADAGGGPRWLQVTAGILVLVALILECLAVALVATVAWPFRELTAGDPSQSNRIRRRLQGGVAITFVAVAVLALGSISSWWPSAAAESRKVRVVTSGGALCGELQPGQQGVLRLDVEGQDVLLALREVSRLQPVDSCP